MVDGLYPIQLRHYTNSAVGLLSAKMNNTIEKDKLAFLHFGLHFYQSLEVSLEVLGTPNTCFLKACVTVLVHAQIKVPVIEICFPWMRRKISYILKTGPKSPIHSFLRLRNWKRWDALFMPEEVVSINFGLHFYQSPEVSLEVLGTPNTCFLKACVRVLVHAHIKVPVIEICFPWIRGNIRCHVFVDLPNPIHMLRILGRIFPRRNVVDKEHVTASVRERNLRFRNFAHHSTRILVAPCSKVLATLKTVTNGGTGTSFTFQEVMIPKLPPPPPLIAQNRSSPMAFRSRTLPWASIIRASMTLSAARPYFLNMVPYAPPVMCPPIPKLVQTPAG
uniref:Uncharacterized protein n=1 Tax=Salix viminalis TaxID=40686 RepID=A0A6N2N7J3_SALVM